MAAGKDVELGSAAIEPPSRPLERMAWRAGRRLPALCLLPLSCLLLITIFTAAVLPVFFTARADGEARVSTNKGQGDVQYSTAALNDPNSETILYVDTILSAFDPSSTLVTVTMRPLVGGAYMRDGAPNILALPATQTLTLNYLSTKRTYKDGDLLELVSVSFPLLSESPLINYPFDRYVLSIGLTACITNNATDPDTNKSVITRQVLELAAALRVTHPQWSTSVREGDDWTGITNEDVTSPNGQLVATVVSTVFTRPNTNKFFSVLIVALMWLISASIFVVAIDISFFRKREYAVPLVALAATILFALPNLRNAQPMVPPVAIAIDALGFIWNMALVSLSLLIGIANVFGQYSHKWVRS